MTTFLSIASFEALYCLEKSSSQSYKKLLEWISQFDNNQQVKKFPAYERFQERRTYYNLRMLYHLPQMVWNPTDARPYSGRCLSDASCDSARVLLVGRPTPETGNSCKIVSHLQDMILFVILDLESMIKIIGSNEFHLIHVYEHSLHPPFPHQKRKITQSEIMNVIKERKFLEMQKWNDEIQRNGMKHLQTSAGASQDLPITRDVSQHQSQSGELLSKTDKVLWVILKIAAVGSQISSCG